MSEPVSPRMRRILEIVYAVDGVHGARVWEWPDEGKTRVAVAVRPAHTTSIQDLLHRVEAAVAGLHEPGEAWDFGVLDSAD
ncbi:hypothetical protein BH09MYX1_BH09MYX1_51850 [soil metagenome]